MPWTKKGPGKLKGNATENHEKSRYYRPIPSLTTPRPVIPLVKVIVKGVAFWHVMIFRTRPPPYITLPLALDSPYIACLW
jgi:hypothetical protein